MSCILEMVAVMPDGENNMWYFAEQMGANGTMNIGYDKDGNPCFGLREEVIKDYYTLLNRFARKGLMPAEVMTYSYDKLCESHNSGNVFAQIRSADVAKVANLDAAKTGTGYRWKLLVNDLTDKALPFTDTGIGWSGTFITKNNKDPKRAIEFMSWMRTEDARRLTAWGIPGVDWDDNENGQTVNTPAMNAALAEGKLKQNDFGIGVWIFGDRGDERSFVNHAVTDPESKDIMERKRASGMKSKIMSELYFAMPSEGNMLNIFNTLIDMRSSEQLKVIYAESDEAFEAAYENMMSQAEALGMSKLNAWMKEQLDAHQAQSK